MSQFHPATATSFTRLLDPAVRHDPYPVYAELRRDGPLWLPHMPAAVVTGYEDCARLLREPRLSSERWRFEGAAAGEDAIPWDAPSSFFQPSFLSLDPPDHTRLRGLVARAFGQATVARLAPGIEALVDRLLDRVDEADEFDVMAGLAYPLPVTIICRMLGVPVEDEALFHTWSAGLTRFMEGLAFAAAGRENDLDWLPNLLEMHRYVEELIAVRRTAPEDDLISALIAVEDGGDRLTPDELASTIVLLLVTGHETTVNLIGNGYLALLRNREHLDRLRTEPAMAESVVEETLRYDPPVQMAVRVAAEPIEVGTLPLPRNSLVFLLLGAAHRDPAAHPDPDRFDPTRPEIRHLAFGLGHHYCIGAPLARLQGRLALTRLAQRLVDAELVLDPPPYRENLNLHGPSALHVTCGDVIR
ncbi:cytochrome P450 [Actinomadura monticuli]|uniref:Cytochrome P450 n=1 Tax=Actinomadura monticuli TaxID=3097367 RepID=A0ABV4Q631_9ACTN